ncbi:hypothetical protein F5888DRAFT_1805770 [Russula emetica]|nr:hypothetical protein F5888DRAFT_1805770 [Russula emetica]
MNHPPVLINAFDYWTSHRLEGHGIQLITAARILLEAHRDELSRSRYDVARDLLDYADDYRQVLRRKYLLPRTKLARQYDRMAVEALHIIEGMLVLRLVPQLRPLGRPTRS